MDDVVLIEASPPPSSSLSSHAPAVGFPQVNPGALPTSAGNSDKIGTVTKAIGAKKAEDVPFSFFSVSAFAHHPLATFVPFPGTSSRTTHLLKHPRFTPCSTLQVLQSTPRNTRPTDPLFLFFFRNTQAEKNNNRLIKLLLSSTAVLEPRISPKTTPYP